MRISECEFIIVPGRGNSLAGHWQTNWEKKLLTARRVHHMDWEHPHSDHWCVALRHEIMKSHKPVVLIAHSAGVIASVTTLANHALPQVIGAFLVAPPDEERVRTTMYYNKEWLPFPKEPLSCKSLLIASRNDPYCAYENAETYAKHWGSEFIDAGEAGHINIEAGFGPWPEGLMRFAGFMKAL